MFVWVPVEAQHVVVNHPINHEPCIMIISIIKHTPALPSTISGIMRGIRMDKHNYPRIVF